MLTYSQGNSLKVLQRLDKEHREELLQMSQEVEAAMRLLSSIPTPPLQDSLAAGGDRLTYLKIHYHYVDTGTLIAYGLPWEFDKEDDSHVVIKKWISERDRGILFDHTQRLRAARRAARADTTTPDLTQASDEKTILATGPNHFNPVRKMGYWIRHNRDPPATTGPNSADQLGVSTTTSTDSDHLVPPSAMNPLQRIRQWRRAKYAAEGDDAEMTIPPVEPKSPTRIGKRQDAARHLRNTNLEAQPEVVEIKPLRASKPGLSKSF